MQKTLFRGKRKDNGEWIEGDLIRHYENQRRFIAYDQLACTYTECGISRLTTERFCEVDPETVGQYTGLTDKNGTKIFEGDIVCDRYANCYTPIFVNGIYMAYNVDYPRMPGEEPSTQFNVVWQDVCIVIGNIHDVPHIPHIPQKEDKK